MTIAIQHDAGSLVRPAPVGQPIFHLSLVARVPRESAADKFLNRVLREALGCPLNVTALLPFHITVLNQNQFVCPDNQLPTEAEQQELFVLFSQTLKLWAAANGKLPLPDFYAKAVVVGPMDAKIEIRRQNDQPIIWELQEQWAQLLGSKDPRFNFESFRGFPSGWCTILRYTEGFSEEQYLTLVDIIKRNLPEELVFRPTVSDLVAALFHRMGMPWQRAVELI